MNREEFKSTLKEILDNNNIGTMATIRDNKPNDCVLMDGSPCNATRLK